MTPRQALIALTLTAFSLGTLNPAAAQNDGPRAGISKHQSKKRMVSESRGQQIACTSLGCRPIPSRCTPRPGMRFNGNPTGYDVIVCP